MLEPKKFGSPEPGPDGRVRVCPWDGQPLSPYWGKASLPAEKVSNRAAGTTKHYECPHGHHWEINYLPVIE